MSSGLFSKNNLSENGLNAVDALQKLYGPQVQEDISLFAFSGRLESRVSSDNQLYGLVNESISDSSGNVSPRTKFITNTFTFSENNLVWIDRSEGYVLDKRASGEQSTGAPVKFSVNGSVVNTEFVGTGTQYEVRNGSGVLVPLPATVNVNLAGVESGSRSCVVQVTVNANGTLSRPGVTVLTPGSGYIDNELLEPVPACNPHDDPSEDKCMRYTGNSLYHVTYNQNTGTQGYKALLRNTKYQYTVKFSGPDGFFLYDNKVSEWVYLGVSYNTTQVLPKLPVPVLQINRYDTIYPQNLTHLYKLDAKSLFFSYGDSYQPEGNLSSSIRSISQSVEDISSSLQTFPQNVRIQAKIGDTTNDLGIPYNILSGQNIRSDYRVIFRDPDGVLDNPSLSFFTLRNLNQPGEVRSGNVSVPGIWLFTGDKYQRVFSSDDKPFFSQSNMDYLSPILSKFSSGSVVSVSSSGEYKYGISAGYYKPNEPLNNTSVRGFNTSVGTLIQNLSLTLNNGGFVYHRTLPVTTVRGNIKSWPLFSYRDGVSTLDAKFLAI
jgi:hypothetical protein